MSAPGFWHDAFWLRRGACGALLCPGFLSSAVPGILAAGKAALLLRASPDTEALPAAPEQGAEGTPATDLCQEVSRRLQRLVRARLQAHDAVLWKP